MLFEFPQAGDVVQIDFSEFGGEQSEMMGVHPALVVSPASLSRSSGTVWIVPLTTAAANARNESAVELQPERSTRSGQGINELLAASPTGRTFAVCNQARAVSLDRPSLRFFDGNRKLRRNSLPRFRVRGENLRLVRLHLMQQFMPETEFRSLLRRDSSGAMRKLALRLKQTRETHRPKMVPEPRNRRRLHHA